MSKSALDNLIFMNGASAVAPAARAELATLREAVEQARPLIEMANELWRGTYQRECAKWLAAHPAPQPQEEQINHG